MSVVEWMIGKDMYGHICADEVETVCLVAVLMRKDDVTVIVITPVH